MNARHVCPRVNLKIKGVDFYANLIVLEPNGIDIILGMDWLSKHKGIIDCARKAVKMIAPNGEEIEYVARHMSLTKVQQMISF